MKPAARLFEFPATSDRGVCKGERKCAQPGGEGGHERNDEHGEDVHDRNLTRGRTGRT